MARDLGGLPPYRRIAEQIIERIRSGELQPGDRVPSVAEIMEREGVSRATAARVPSVLRSEGYAHSAPGVGTTVRARATLTPGADRLTLIRDGGNGLDTGEQVEILERKTEPANQEIADALGLQAGDEVALRRRRYSDAAGTGYVSTTWISAALAEQAPEFLDDEKLPRMTFGLIEDRTGRRVTRRRDTVAAREVPGDIASHLDVEPGTRVLAVINHYWDQDGEPTEFAIDYYAPGREASVEHGLG